jgi:hypothetical protein
MAEPSINPNRGSQLLTGALIAVTLAALVFAQLFLTFRGLSNPLGMEQAQLARELARGHGFHTLTIRPAQWRQQMDHGKVATVEGMPDTFDPPLQPLVLAPLFKLLSAESTMDENRGVFLMDRVVACVAVLFFLAACGVSWATARRLFDAKIAGWTVATALVCGLLWDVARSGLPQMMALFFFSLALHGLAKGLELVRSGRNAVTVALLMGLSGVCMVLTHWMCVWMVLGMTAVAAWQLRPRITAALLVGGLPLLALFLWGLRNYQVSGDFLGAARSMAQGIFSPHSEAWLMRDFSGNSPLAVMLLRKLAINAVAQMRDGYTLLGGAIPALLFFVTLLHPFKKEEVRAFARGLAIIWLVVFVGMAAVGLPREEEDANQMHVLFIPAMSMFGMAFLMVLWARMGLKTPYGGWWSEHGAPALATALTAAPLILGLSVEVSAGLSNRSQFSHWPPYLPNQIAHVATFTGEHEVVMSDIPWAVAWYADRPGVWIPQDQAQFAEMRQAAEKQKAEIAGFLFTPESLRAKNFADLFTGEYRAWAALAFRGTGYGFGVDVAGRSDFPYRELLPLARLPQGDRFTVEMFFLSDKKRWETHGQPVADSGGRK